MGWSAFTIALITYALTIEPTVSFWDAGEYILTSSKLPVGHPPGAPLCQMLGAFFSLFALEPAQIGMMLNMMSAVSSAFTILFMFWTITMLLRRLVNVDETAIEQNAPLQEILMNLSMDYERLNDLMNKRESELQGRGILIVLFVCIGLPGLIGFLVGLFTPASSGFQIEGVLSTFSLFFAAASAVGVAVSGRMLGRMRDTMWFVPGWMAMSMFIFLGATKLIGG